MRPTTGLIFGKVPNANSMDWGLLGERAFYLKSGSGKCLDIYRMYFDKYLIDLEILNIFQK